MVFGGSIMAFFQVDKKWLTSHGRAPILSAK